MTEVAVTARDAAAPAAATIPFHDADRICEILNKALDDTSIAYSTAVQFLFQQAWTVATHKRNTQVTVYHMAYALFFHQREVGQELAGHLESDVDSFAVGCVLRLLPLGVAERDLPIINPAVGTERWVSAAVALARTRGQPSELQPEDLVQAVLGRHVHASVRDDLKRAARVGNARCDAVLGPRPEPMAAALESPGDILDHLRTVEKGDADFTEMIKYFKEFRQHYSAEIEKQNQVLARAGDNQTEALNRISTLIASRPAPGPQPLPPLDDVVKQLKVIDRRVMALGDALPRAPSGARLAAAIVAVLTLGGAAGLALALQEPGSRLGQIIAASLK